MAWRISKPLLLRFRVDVRPEFILVRGQQEIGISGLTRVVRWCGMAKLWADQRVFKLKLLDMNLRQINWMDTNFLGLTLSLYERF
jgi:hypothetical protein